MTTKDDAAEANTDTNKPDNASATANAPGSAAGEAGKPAQDKPKGKIPPPPKKGAAKPAKAAAPKPAAKVNAGANADFKEPGSTLNPADPNAPNYAFQPAGGDDASLGADQSIDQGTSEQPPSIGVADPVEAADDLVWSDEKGPRGRVISVSRGGDGGPTTTFEEALPPEASAAQVGLVKERLRRRLGS